MNGRYDNLHGDEDEIEFTWEELQEMDELEADLWNEQEWLEEYLNEV